MKRRSRLATLALAVLALAGCRESDAELARRTVDEFTAALVRGEGTAACDRLAEAGVSELLLVALQADLRETRLGATTVDRCAVIARELAEDAPELSRIRDARVSRTLLEGDVATVETDAGAYELEEVHGRWRVTRFEPVAAVLAGLPAPVRPVSLTIARPELSEPALGKALAGHTRDETVELTGTFTPADARVTIEHAPGTRVHSAEVGDGRLRVELRLRRGHNQIRLLASAPGRADTELAVRLTRE